ncbi:MAG TPA: hypothetical protein VHO43_17175 [Ignavibacteriales bacterium]|nr:hypothetical protein [Ignavibacteriales bacterium]
MTTPYTQNVRDNILPLSNAQTLPAAFKEWQFTGNTIDHEKPIEQCQLCNQEDLRYHFEIQNFYTHAKLMVGSQCILKFQIAVYDKGILLDKSDARKKLNKLTKEMHFRYCIKALLSLAQKEDDDRLFNALIFYERNRFLTPKYANLVLWKLNLNKIDHNPAFFKINLAKPKYKEAISAMESFKIKRIWPALTSSQRKLVESLRKTPYQEAVVSKI